MVLALHWASMRGNDEIISLLIKGGGNVNDVDNNNCTPLHCAAAHDHVNVIKLLVESKADATIQDELKHDMLFYCSSTTQAELRELVNVNPVAG